MRAREFRLWLLSHLERKQSRRWVPDMPPSEEAEAYMERNAEKWRRPLDEPLGPEEVR